MPIDVAAARLRQQRLTRTTFRDPVSVVQWLGAVQAQEYPAARWGLGLRGTGFGDADVEDAVNRGAILRTHVLRPTWHFLAPADIRWILALTGPRVQATMATYHRTRAIDAALLAKSRKVIERTLRGGRTRTRTEIGDALRRAGIDVKTLRLGFVMIDAELEGLVCSGPRRGKESTYALLEERVPPAPMLKGDEALAELTRRYFTSHGPATIRDFAWWSGLTQVLIKRGIEILGSRLTKITAQGLTCWSCESPRPQRTSKPSAHLLPIYDEFLIAYRDRVFMKRDPKTPKLHIGPDTFSHYLVIDGRLAGSWKPAETGGSVSVAIALYGRISRAERDAIQSAAERYGQFIRRPITVHIA
jgi:DNA glycosylase AlkZ-like